MTEKRKFLQRTVGSSVSLICIWFIVHIESGSLALFESGISGGDGVEFIPHAIVCKLLGGDSSKISEVELDLGLIAQLSVSSTLSLLNFEFGVGGTDRAGFKIGRSSLGLHSITLDIEA